MKRKEKLGAFILLLAGLITVGCSKRTPRHSSQLNNSSETTTLASSSKKVTKKDVKKDYKKLYQPIFEDYQKILTSPKDTASIASLYQSLQATERPINSWAIENAVNQADEMRYAFADLNNDGIVELLIADLNVSGKYFLTGLYYLQAGKPVLLAEGFVAGHGGARNAALVYKLSLIHI